MCQITLALNIISKKINYSASKTRIEIILGDAIKNFIIIFMLLLPLLVAYDADAETKDTPHYDVVAEYIRSLGAIHRIQQTAIKESQDKTDNDNPTKKMMDAIRSATRFKLELSSSIAALERIKLKEPFETLIPYTIYSYKQKKELYDKIIKISTTFLDTAPKPGVDYSKMLAIMPEITASMEYIDESIFKSMVLVFALLIDEKPDSEGHMSHLNITKAQRQKLIHDIDGLFGENLDKKDKNWTVASASLLKAYLLKDYKCIDE